MGRSTPARWAIVGALAVAGAIVSGNAEALSLRLDFDVLVEELHVGGGPDGTCGSGAYDPAGSAGCPFQVGLAGLLRFELDTASDQLSPHLGGPSFEPGRASTGELWGWLATASTSLGSVSLGSEGLAPPATDDWLPHGTLWIDLQDGSEDVLRIIGVNAHDATLASVVLRDSTGTAFDPADLVDRAALDRWLAEELDVSLFDSGTWSFDLLDDGSGPAGTVKLVGARRTTTLAPEPVTAGLVGLGLAGLAARRGGPARRRS